MRGNTLANNIKEQTYQTHGHLYITETLENLSDFTGEFNASEA
jgi:hypothetical protein